MLGRPQLGPSTGIGASARMPTAPASLGGRRTPMHSLVTQTPFPDRQEHARERERRACSLFLDDPFQLELYSYTTAGICRFQEPSLAQPGKPGLHTHIHIDAIAIWTLECPGIVGYKLASDLRHHRCDAAPGRATAVWTPSSRSHRPCESIRPPPVAPTQKGTSKEMEPADAGYIATGTFHFVDGDGFLVALDGFFRCDGLPGGLGRYSPVGSGTTREAKAPPALLRPPTDPPWPQGAVTPQLGPPGGRGAGGRRRRRAL